MGDRSYGGAKIILDNYETRTIKIFKRLGTIGDILAIFMEFREYLDGNKLCSSKVCVPKDTKMHPVQGFEQYDKIKDDLYERHVIKKEGYGESPSVSE